jgi:hypothetical protein
MKRQGFDPAFFIGRAPPRNSRPRQTDGPQRHGIEIDVVHTDRGSLPRAAKRSPYNYRLPATSGRIRPFGAKILVAPADTAVPGDDQAPASLLEIRRCDIRATGLTVGEKRALINGIGDPVRSQTPGHPEILARAPQRAAT